jgi:diketogulonate reductase-like aldo/keto reductase
MQILTAKNMKSINTTVTLNNGIEMPILGLGTWKMSDGDEVERAVSYALEAGYRLIDTAKLYGNEAGVGRAIRASGIAREEIFVTTKLWPTDFFNPEAGFEASLKRLDLDYVDLYLIHWPIPLMPQSVWQKLEKIYEQKLVRAIGVSNYGIDDLEKLLSYAKITPAVNQIKFSPFDFEKEILNFCNSKHIVVEAYSPLTRGSHLNDRTIQTLAKKYGKTAAQIMIRWCIEHGTVVIPKSSHPDRIKENADVFDFELAAEDMQTLDRLR